VDLLREGVHGELVYGDALLRRKRFYALLQLFGNPNGEGVSTCPLGSSTCA
jgi:hypothetical protein